MTRRWYVNARLLTPGSTAPYAASLAVENGRIAAVERDRAVRPAPEDEVVDLGGRTCIPGPVDAHCHLVSYGLLRRREADLRGADSMEEVARRLREHARLTGIRPGDGRWLLGRGFDQELMESARWPTGPQLDAFFPDTPVRITRVCGHAVVASAPALRHAGIEPTVSEPGLPPGVVTESRIAPLHTAIPAPDEQDYLNAARWACADAARAGFVGVHVLAADLREVQALAALAGRGELPIRIVVQLPFSLLEHARERRWRTGVGDDFFTWGAVKLFSDGSLGARTAALLAPYSDDPTTDGELIFSPEELERRIAAVYRAGFQVCIHAIGDRAMVVTLQAMRGAARSAFGTPLAPHPPRIEHASMVNPEIVQTMLALRAAAAVQPQFAWSDRWIQERVGSDRARGCYAFAALHDAGVPLAGSTDCPVESLDALAAIGSMVHRPPWLPEGGLPVTSALRAFSEGSYSVRGLKGGSLEIGQFADFLALDADPSAVEPQEIAQIPVAATVVGGEIRSQRA
jgi:predicted amidohydrolase YtcJ